MDPRVGEKIRAADFGPFLDNLVHAGEDSLQRRKITIVKGLAERFWDTTNTFHFPRICDLSEHATCRLVM